MKKVLVLAGDADHNLGDAAIFQSLCCALRTAQDDIQITSVGEIGGPASQNETVSIPRGAKGFPRLLKCARGQDLVIIGGGGLLQDDDSRIKMPYWALRTALMRSLSARVAGYCLGAGPLTHRDSQLFARWACASMHSVSVRDAFAQSWLQRCTSRRVTLVPDPAFMLQASSADRATQIVTEAGLRPGRLIGVALRRWFHTRGGWLPHKMRVKFGLDRGVGWMHMSMFVKQLATSLEKLSKQLDCGILLMPSYDLAHEGDVTACRSLAAELNGKVPTGFALIRSASDYKAVAGAVTLMVSARMHPLIFAASMGTPVIGLPYNGKFGGLFDLLGLPRRLVWMDEFKSRDPGDQIFQLAREALEDSTDLRARANELAVVTRTYTARLLNDALPDAG